MSAGRSFLGEGSLISLVGRALVVAPGRPHQSFSAAHHVGHGAGCDDRDLHRQGARAALSASSSARGEAAASIAERSRQWVGSPRADDEREERACDRNAVCEGEGERWRLLKGTAAKARLGRNERRPRTSMRVRRRAAASAGNGPRPRHRDRARGSAVASTMNVERQREKSAACVASSCACHGSPCSRNRRCRSVRHAFTGAAHAPRRIVSRCGRCREARRGPGERRKDLFILREQPLHHLIPARTSS